MSPVALYIKKKALLTCSQKTGKVLASVYSDCSAHSHTSSCVSWSLRFCRSVSQMPAELSPVMAKAFPIPTINLPRDFFVALHQPLVVFRLGRLASCIVLVKHPVVLAYGWCWTSCMGLLAIWIVSWGKPVSVSLVHFLSAVGWEFLCVACKRFLLFFAFSFFLSLLCFLPSLW